MNRFEEISKNHEFAIQWIEALQRNDTQFEIFRLMRHLSEQFGCRAFVVADLPDLTVSELAASSIITNCPPELMTLFDQGKFLGSSPIISTIRTSVLPLKFNLRDAAHQRGSEEVMQLFNRFAMDSGAVFPVSDALGKRGWVGLAGCGVDFAPEQMMQLTYCCIHVYQRLSDLRLRDAKPTETLAERELACLTWTAAGKTSAEIAEILDLSEHTVNHYLNRITKKLDAVNRTQAVAKAIRRNLIT